MGEGPQQMFLHGFDPVRNTFVYAVLRVWESVVVLGE